MAIMIPPISGNSAKLKDLKTWFEEQLDNNKVEPNSGLGEAISYMLKHWKERVFPVSVLNSAAGNMLSHPENIRKDGNHDSPHFRQFRYAGRGVRHR
jgi:hypothetical protein